MNTPKAINILTRVETLLKLILLEHSLTIFLSIYNIIIIMSNDLIHNCVKTIINKTESQ